MYKDRVLVTCHRFEIGAFVFMLGTNAVRELQCDDAFLPALCCTSASKQELSTLSNVCEICIIQAAMIEEHGKVRL